MILVNKIIKFSVYRSGTSSVDCIVGLPHKVKSPSVTLHLTHFVLLHLPPPPFPSGNHHTVVCN